MADIRLYNGGLDDDDETDDIVLRGVLDQSTIKYIRMAWYQREQGFSKAHIDQMVTTLLLGRKVADVTIGMRGEKYTESKGDIFTLHDDCYCTDGGQRLYAAAIALKERPTLKIKIGAKIYFNTTEESENEMFCQLGTTQKRISASVLIRNWKMKSLAAKVLVDLNEDPDFALHTRVAWGQVKTRHELITGYSLTRVIGALHSHKQAGVNTQKIDPLRAALDLVIDKIGAESFRSNVINFFDGIDQCWTIRNQGATGRQNAYLPHLRVDFLTAVARLVSAYPDFWDGKDRNDFNFLDRHVRMLRRFPLRKYIAASARTPQEMLYELLRKQLQLAPTYEDANGQAQQG